jgi:hypothetical protein
MQKDNADYSADDIVGLVLYAKRSGIKGLSVPSINSSVIHTYNAGDLIGQVYSYIVHPDGLYWMFDYSGGSFYVKHEKDAFSTESFKDQGVLSTKEKVEREIEQNETIAERVKTDIKKVIRTLTIVAIVIIILVALVELNKQYHFTDKLKKK